MERAFMYGDLVFETIKVVNAKPLLVNLHFERLIKSAQILEFELPPNFTLENFTNQLQQAIDLAVGTNNFLNLYRLRYTLYRDSEGFYLPKFNKTDYKIDVFLFEPTKSFANLTIGIYKEQFKCTGKLANLKSGNALIYVMASLWAQKNRFDDVLILNQHGRIIEAISSNLFWVKDGIVFTPPLSEGCVDGVYRKYLMQEQSVIEQVCRTEDLELADEIFITNALHGKRFVNVKLYL